MRIAYLVAVLLLIGCTKKNDDFCLGAPQNHCDNVDGQRCDGNEDCKDAATPVCKLGGEEEPVCVQCVANTDCRDATAPACGDDNRCTGCRTDDDCASKACLHTGVCAAADSVIYAKANGSGNSPCGREVGQNECSLKQAVAEMSATGRSVIRLAPEAYDPANDLTISIPTTLIARNATLQRSGTGSIIRVNAGQRLTLVGAIVKGARGDHAIRCDSNSDVQIHEARILDSEQYGILADACELTISRSTMRGNRDGALKMIGDARKVEITNNFIVRNGEADVSETGGMWLKLANESVVEFNTVVDNRANVDVTTAGGIKCEGTVFNLANNIIYRNSGGPGGSQDTVLCTFNQSYVVHGAPGENNVGFLRPNDAVEPDFHLTAESPPTVRNVPECTAPKVAFDFDRNPRPAGTNCDYGADEVSP